MALTGLALEQRARLPLLAYLACLLLPFGLALEASGLEALGVRSTERRKLGNTEFVLAYTDTICGGYPQQLANPFTAPTIEDVIFGGIRDFTALGSVKGIDVSFTDAYVDKTSQTYYPRGVYELALYYNDYPSPPGARIPLLPRVAGRRNALTTLPTTAAALDMSQLGKFADKGAGSLQSATVCCSDDNMFESMRAVRQMIGDTKIGLPVCTGYPVEVKRPAAFPLWAGVRLTVQQPIGSNEYVIASIQFIWASDTPTPVALPPPSPPAEPAALPSVNPPFLPKGASPDWLAIATGVVSFQLVEPTVSIIMTKRSFPIANSDVDQTVIAATRFNRGAAVALASENMLQHCCGGALSTSAKQLNATAKGLDLLVLQGALWAAWYWVKTGTVRVRVSHERYVPLARWLSAQRPGLFQTPAEQDMPSYVTSPDLFIRNIKGTVGQGKRPPEHLYILGPEDPVYSDPAMANAMRDYLNAAGGVMFLGPNPTAIRGDTGGGGSSGSSSGSGGSDSGGSTSSNGSPDFEVVTLDDPPPPPPAKRRKKNQSPPPPAGTVSGSTTSNKRKRPPPPASRRRAAEDPARIVPVGPSWWREGAGVDDASQRSDVEEEASTSGLRWLLRGLSMSGRSRRRLLDGTTPVNNSFTTAYPINAVSGPFGIFFAPPATPTVQPGTISVVTEPRSDINNAELAAGAYVQFLQGQKPKDFDLSIVSLTIAKARASIPRGTPGSDGFYTLVDALYALGGSLPEIKYSPPPPPAQRSSPPPSPPPPRSPPPPPSGTPSGGGAGNSTGGTGSNSGPWSFLGCYVDNVSNRALPWRLSVSDKAISIERCGGLALKSNLAYFGMQGSVCFGGNNGTLATQYGKVDAMQCNTACMGDRSQMCGFVSASRQLLSLYQVSLVINIGTRRALRS